VSPFAAIAFVAIQAGFALFQAALALGAPVGRFAWGGQHDRLPSRLRLGSLVAIALYAVFSGIVLERAGLSHVLPGGAWLSIAAWVVTALIVLGIAPNAMSRSRPERMVMTPLAIVLSLLALTVALGF
jgi:uncharacterized membrane protein SirB2